jgi:hypothetical protein
MKEPKKKKINYPKTKKLLVNDELIFMRKFLANMTDEVRYHYNAWQALIDKAIPHLDAIELYSATIKVTELDYRTAYGPGWDTVDKGIKKKQRDASKKGAKQRKEQMAFITEIMNAHARQLATFPDEQIEELEQLADQLAA